MSLKRVQAIRDSSTGAFLFGLGLLIFICGGVQYQVYSEQQLGCADAVQSLPQANAKANFPYKLDEGLMGAQTKKKEHLALQNQMLLDMKKKEYQLRVAEHLREWGTSRGVRRGQQVTLESTGYTCGPESTGKYPSAPDYCQTASGYRLRPGDKVVAMGKKYPFGTVVIIPGYGLATVRDRGGAVSDRHIDLYFEQVEDALRWGRRMVNVTVL